MTKYTAVIEGMSCSMCEAHINDVIRAEFKVKKVKSDRKSNTAVIIAEDGAVDEGILIVAYNLVDLKVDGYEIKVVTAYFLQKMHRAVAPQSRLNKLDH